MVYGFLYLYDSSFKLVVDNQPTLAEGQRDSGEVERSSLKPASYFYLILKEKLVLTTIGRTLCSVASTSQLSTTNLKLPGNSLAKQSVNKETTS
jgi:hypothetical protein